MLPLGTALLLNGYWPLQLVMYAVVWSRTKTPRPLTGKLVGGYLVIGVLAGLVSALRCIGISYMLGSVYVIISTADLPINTLLSRCVLRKKFEPLQYLAVACAMCGIALVMLQKESDADRLKQHCDGDSCIDDWAPYIVASLFSALFSATNSVLGEFLLSKDKKNPILGVCEVSFFNSFIPFCSIGIFMLVTHWWAKPLTGLRPWADIAEDITARHMQGLFMLVAGGLLVVKRPARPYKNAIENRFA
jgi:drug/metabolite transporter (DMT)-like permease